MGADLVEVDVRRRPDGVLVCAHDEITADSPLLSEVVALVGASGAGMHVDLKEPGYEAELVAAIGSVQPVFFTTGDVDSVRALRAIGATGCLTLGPSFAGRPVRDALRGVVSDALPWRRIEACDAVGVAVQFRIGWWGLRWWCRRRDLAVLIWTVNEDWRLRRLMRARGVTAVVTDRPGRALALR